MIIECVPDADSPSLLSIEIDGEFWRRVHPALFGKQPHLPKAENLALFEEAFDALERKLANQYAIKCLARKQYLSHELKQKLSDLLVSEQTISHLLQQYREFGYINDPEWIQQFIKKQRIRGYGPQAIQSKLRQKGVSLAQIPQGDPIQQIQKILSAPKFQARNLSLPKEKQRTIAFLIRRGFSFSDILAALNA